MKRIFDMVVAMVMLCLLLPVFIVIAVLIAWESKGGVFYQQQRIGKGQVPFPILKFRTMSVGSDQKSLITVGDRDQRITRMGYFLRKYKIDEFPQLWNVLKGEMSIVGPRPEVKRYTDLYTPEQQRVLEVRPGMTDYASFDFIDESEILAKSSNPEQTYVEEIMPQKLALNLKYIHDQSFLVDLKIIIKTLLKIIGK
ncbi:MAG: sugar transferase [Saprospiraceae bacterium]